MWTAPGWQEESLIATNGDSIARKPFLDYGCAVPAAKLTVQHIQVSQELSIRLLEPGMKLAFRCVTRSAK